MGRRSWCRSTTQLIGLIERALQAAADDVLSLERWVDVDSGGPKDVSVWTVGRSVFVDVDVHDMPRSEIDEIVDTFRRFLEGAGIGSFRVSRAPDRQPPADVWGMNEAGTYARLRGFFTGSGPSADRVRSAPAPLVAAFSEWLVQGLPAEEPSWVLVNGVPMNTTISGVPRLLRLAEDREITVAAGTRHTSGLLRYSELWGRAQFALYVGGPDVSDAELSAEATSLAAMAERLAEHVSYAVVDYSTLEADDSPEWNERGRMAIEVVDSARRCHLRRRAVSDPDVPSPRGAAGRGSRSVPPGCP